MKLKDFKFSDQDVRRDVVRSEKLIKKINFAMKYLVKHLPVNKLKKDNSFDFTKLKFNEGKNYDWFFLNKEDITILVRQYGNHFTFFVNNDKGDYHSKLSVFTINDNKDKMSDDESDSFCDDNFQNIQNYLPHLVEKIEADKVHTIWDSEDLKAPNYTEIKMAMDARESVQSLDTLIFACDELFNMYICTYAENEVLEQLKNYKVGDMFGSAYKIIRVSSELINHGGEPYYHSSGLEYTNTNFPDSKPTWSDVYSLARYHSDELDYENILLEKKVMKHVYQNHNNVLTEIVNIEDQDYMWMKLVGLYVDKMYELYTDEIDRRVFGKCITEQFRDYIEMSYRITQSI